MTYLEHLRACTSLYDLAALIGFKPKAIAWLAWGASPDRKYTKFSIPKRSGGSRTINAPIPPLRLAQRRLSQILQHCEMEMESSLNVKCTLAHGFKPNHSILTNATVHTHRHYVLNIDLEDFFGTINFGRVRGYFITNRHFSLQKDVATIIAQLACYENKLPQGSPLSPVISNLLGNILDVRLSKVAHAYGCAYSRYVDDITISTSYPTFPRSLIEVDKATGSPSAGVELRRAVQACGFRINASKTRLKNRRTRQDVTGIVVNDHVNVNADYKRTVRAMVHRLCSSGEFTRRIAVLDGAGDTQLVSTQGTRPQLRGMLSFISQVERYARRTATPATELTGNDRLTRRFLFYTIFANPDVPTILFEGKTDAIYISCAIRQLFRSFPTLANAEPGRRALRLLRPTDALERLFGLKGGSESLSKFIKNYRQEFRRIRGPKGTHPLIVIFDNDDGCKGVLKMLNKVYDVHIDPGAQSFRAYENLYLVLTSPVGSGPHYIEKCFDVTTLATKISGKIFNPGNSNVGPGEYGKAWFANKVVKPNIHNINFDGFKELLHVISTVIEHHSTTTLAVSTP